jgi:hypothetical protein
MKGSQLTVPRVWQTVGDGPVRVSVFRRPALTCKPASGLAAEQARGVQELAVRLAIPLASELTPFGAQVDFTGAEAVGPDPGKASGGRKSAIGDHSR